MDVVTNAEPSADMSVVPDPVMDDLTDPERATDPEVDPDSAPEPCAAKRERSPEANISASTTSADASRVTCLFIRFLVTSPIRIFIR